MSNICTMSRAEFDWKDGKQEDSLKAFRDAVAAKIDDAVRWYQGKRYWPRWQGWGLRVSAIIFGALATAVPAISEMKWTIAGWAVQPSVATVLGVVAATLLLIDRFQGSTSAWVRFSVAEMSLKEIADELPFAYSQEMKDWDPASGPTVEQTSRGLAMLRDFLLRANQVVRDETNQWKAEFLGAIQQIDDSVKAIPRKAQDAVAVVTIGNAERLAGDWALSVDNGPEETVSGDSRAVRHAPGPIRIRVRGMLRPAGSGESKPFCKESAESLAAGEAKTITIELK
jgi:hypothetical protein